MADTTGEMVWTVVEVWRGVADRAHVFASRSDARRLYLRLSRRCNLEEDDVQMFETNIVKPSRRARRRGR